MAKDKKKKKKSQLEINRENLMEGFNMIEHHPLFGTLEAHTVMRQIIVPTYGSFTAD